MAVSLKSAELSSKLVFGALCMLSGCAVSLLPTPSVSGRDSLRCVEITSLLVFVGLSATGFAVIVSMGGR
ncbi:putative type III secretion protein [Aeromonas salmonicida subsp. masoucida NBRC 13784]|nr:putative type III secretion protein [Aeromonas salmonicida subsp. masoucida NBRC 13784]